MCEIRKIIKTHTLRMLVLVGLLALIACGQQETKPATTTQTVPVIKTFYQTVPIYKDYIGNTGSFNTVQIRARVTGYLTNFFFDEGAYVKEGDLLYTIDQRPFIAALNATLGELADSLAQLKFQQVEFVRMKTMYEQAVISKEQFDKFTETLKRAEASVEISKSRVEDAKINLSYTTMYAPISGKIDQTNIHPGNYVGTEDQMILSTLIQLDPIYVFFSPSVSEYLDIMEFAKENLVNLEVTIPNNDNVKFRGHLMFSNNKADINTSTVLLRSTVKNPDHTLLPNVYVNVRVFLGENPKAILIPETAVTFIQDRIAVYVVNHDNQIQQRLIAVSGTQKKHYIVTAGLKSNELVVTADLQKLRSGDKINPQLVTPKRNN